MRWHSLDEKFYVCVCEMCVKKASSSRKEKRTNLRPKGSDDVKSSRAIR